MSTRKREEYSPQVERAIAEAEGGSFYVLNQPSFKPRITDYTPLATPKAKGCIIAPQYRSELERERAEYLELHRAAGEILAWWYEPCQLQIGGGAKYKPDFLVFNRDLSLDFEETKGFWREAHRIRIKAAAAQFPIFRFRGITKDAEGWHTEEFKP